MSNRLAGHRPSCGITSSLTLIAINLLLSINEEFDLKNLDDETVETVAEHGNRY